MNQISTAALNSFAAMDCPVLTMPHGGLLPPMTASGRRIIVGADGIYKEVRRPWLHALVEVGRCRTPYGKVNPVVRFASTLPRALLDEFLVYAWEANGQEVAAWVVWDERSKAMQLLKLQPITRSKVHVTFDRPELPAYQHIFLDVHSHHTMSQEFSSVDDADDRANGGTYIAGVLGHIDTKPTWNFRLCLDGEPVEFLLSNLEIGDVT